MITVTYTAVDGFKEIRRFKAIPEASDYAQYWIGKHPEINHGYAIADDGVGKITVIGATLHDLFPDETVSVPPTALNSPTDHDVSAALQHLISALHEADVTIRTYSQEEYASVRIRIRYIKDIKEIAMCYANQSLCFEGNLGPRLTSLVRAHCLLYYILNPEGKQT